MSSTPDASASAEPAVPNAPADTPPSDDLRMIRIALAIMAIIAVVGTMTYLGTILQKLLIALFLYYAISPAARALVRRGVPGWLAYLLLLVGAVVFATLVGRMLYANALQFTDKLPDYKTKIDALVSRLSSKDSAAVAKMFEEASNTVIRSALGTALGLVEAGVMVFFYLLFIILNSQKIKRRVQRAFSDKRAAHLLLIGQKINEGMQQYMKTKTHVSLGMALTSTLILYFGGLDYYLLWGFLFFALNYITYVGSIAACVPPVALAFLDFQNPWNAVILSGLLIGNRFFWIDYVEIKLSGQSLNIDPLLLLLSLAYWGWFWGLVGLVLAVPMLTSLKIVLANIESTRHWAILLSEE